MRLLLAAALLAACSTDDLCAGRDGQCLGLRISGDGNSVSANSVDQLSITLSGAAFTPMDTRTPVMPGGAHAFPVTTAILLPPVSGIAHVEVAGFLSGSFVGGAAQEVTLAPGRHQTIELVLTRGGVDMMPPAFDLTTVDLSVADLAAPDLAVDLGPPPRHIFLASARAANFGPRSGIDAICAGEASAAGLPGTYRALVGYSRQTDGGVDDEAYFIGPAQEGRNIVVPSGAVVATDATFWQLMHDHAINELADTSAATASCVWTNASVNGALFPPGNKDCNNWTSVDPLVSAAAGDPQSVNITWSTLAFTPCDATCHVYCIEQ